MFVGAVMLVQHPHRCWADETTQRGASVALYAGTGVVSIANNESGPDEYDVRRAGAGIYGVVRFHQEPEPATDHRDRGLFFAGGLTAESDWIKQTQCFVYCATEPVTVAAGGYLQGGAQWPLPRTFHRESELGVRLGMGYSFALFEFRVGGVVAVPSENAAFTRRLLLPDVLLRVGSRPKGWFELGLGAYDSSTTLRPGLYVGGSLLSAAEVRISAHLGLHLVYGSHVSSVYPFGGMADLSLEHALTKSWLAGLGGKVMSGMLFEGTLHLTNLF